MRASYLGKLPNEVTEEDLHKWFDPFGKIIELKVMRDGDKRTR